MGANIHGAVSTNLLKGDPFPFPARLGMDYINLTNIFF